RTSAAAPPACAGLIPELSDGQHRLGGESRRHTQQQRRSEKHDLAHSFPPSLCTPILVRNGARAMTPLTRAEKGTIREARYVVESRPKSQRCGGDSTVMRQFRFVAIFTASIVLLLGVALREALAVCTPTIYSVTSSAPPPIGFWTDTSGAVWNPP